MENIIYMDNGATTPMIREVVDIMKYYQEVKFANASSIYNFAMENKIAIDNSRREVAQALMANPSEIFFTSGGTESDNWAIKGAAIKNITKGKHIITSKIEHHAVLNSCEFLEKLGFEVTYISVDSEGYIDIHELEESIRKDTVLVSVMMANNEVGTIEKIEQIGDLCKKRGILFHTDAVQAFGKIHIDVNKIKVDLLSISAHKFNGPKGVGALYIRKGVSIENLIHGGAQERDKRGGTYNTPAIAAMGVATKSAMENMKNHDDKIEKLQSLMIDELLKIEGSFINGPSLHERLIGNINLGFKGIQNETLLMILDDKNICVSAGSACQAGAVEPSHVLIAMGLSEEEARSSIRISLSYLNTEEEVYEVVKVLNEAVERIRKNVEEVKINE